MTTNENNETEFWVTTGEELKSYGYTADNRPIIKLNINDVPKNLQQLIPLAEQWGINDDVIRYDVIEKSSVQDLELLINAINKTEIQDALEEWLAGSSTNMSNFSDSYIAFSAMRLAAEEAEDFIEYK